MLFSIVVALMVILITAFWAYQGFFGGMIMFLETVVACIVAFAFYEDINALWVDSTGPGIGPPLALMLLFLVVLFVLRYLTDRFMPHNVSMPMMLDRAGGAICGLFTAEVLVGMALLSIQMLPIGSTLFGFERYTVDKEGKVTEHDLSFFKPDRFTAGLATMLSRDRFGGENPLGRAKPDLVLSLYSGRATPQSEARVFLPSDALKVRAMWQARQVDELISEEVGGDGKMARSFESIEPVGAKNTFLVCAISVNNTAAKKGKQEIRFRLPQFRIVGPPPAPAGRPSPEPKVYLAAAMSDIYTHKDFGPTQVDRAQVARLVRFGPLTNFILSPGQTQAVNKGTAYEFEVAFEVSEDFVPWYVEFKRGARVDLTNKKLLKEPPSGGSRALGERSSAGRVAASDRKVGRAPGGRTHLANAIEEGTGAINTLPIPLDKNNSQVQRYVRGGKFAGGDGCHITVEIPKGEIDPEAQVTEFDVPSDKRMIQIGADRLHALSMFGKALGFANQTLAQIFVTDSNGKEYFAIGQYSFAPVGGRDIFEIQFYPGAMMPERCLRKPKKVTGKVLQRVGRTNSKFGFLFLVDPGAEIVKFNTNRRTSQSITNLKAPN